MGSFDERLRVETAAGVVDSTRSQFRTLLTLGLVHPVLGTSDPRTWVEGHASLGLGPTFFTGHWHVPLREDLTFAHLVTPWLTVQGGLGLGVTLDATSSPRSFGELALPLGVTLFKRVEVIYRPLLSLPLGSEKRTVFEGQSTLSTRLAVLPFELLLRVRVAAWGG